MKRMLSVAFLAIGLCAVYATVSYSNMHAAQRRLEKVDVLVPVGMPLRVSAATTAAPDGRDMSTLTYSITNVSGKNLSDSQLAVFIVGP